MSRPKLKNLWTLCATILILQGCASVMKAPGTPISEDYSKRTFGTVLDDQSIENRAHANIASASPELESAHVVAVSFNGVVLLAGQVASSEMRDLAEKTVKNIRKVRTVHNELEVAGPTSMVARSNDSWLTTKIKSKMAIASKVDANRFKIVTENGVVYMLGLVTRDEASAAVDLTRQVYGVQKIVKVFEYLN